MVIFFKNFIFVVARRKVIPLISHIVAQAMDEGSSNSCQPK